MSGDDSVTHADVYIVTQKQTHSAARRVLWRMTVEDAQAVCSDPSTCGVGAYGGEWMLCWTAHQLVDLQPDAFVADDGRFDPLFDRLGVTVLASRNLLRSGEAFSRLRGVATPTQIVPEVVSVPKRITATPQQLTMFGDAA